MKKTILRIVGIIIIFLMGLSNTYSYTANDYFNIYYQGNANWQDLYIVPNGKDLVINFLYSNQVTKSEMFFRDNGIDIAGGEFVENKNNVFLVIKDLLQVKDGNALNNYTITGFLVDEDEDIENYLEGNSSAWNKNIFTKEDIDFIYFREFIFFIFLMIIRFFEIILGRKLVMR